MTEDIDPDWPPPKPRDPPTPQPDTSEASPTPLAQAPQPSNAPDPATGQSFDPVSSHGLATRVAAAQYLKDAGGLKLVVVGADGQEIAAMFVQGSVTYDEEEATFIAVAKDGHTIGELFVDETVGYDESIDAFVIRSMP